jgi:hypothetical protein
MLMAVFGTLTNAAIIVPTGPVSAAATGTTQ